MTARVVVVAGSGSALADLTSAVMSVEGACMVRHASGSSPLDRLIAALAPDLVVIGDLGVPAQALARLAEIRRAAPAAKVVVLSDSADADWLADALRADAAAVLPGNVDARTLGIVLREVLAERDGATAAPAEHVTLMAPERGRRRPTRGIEAVQRGHAA